MVAIIGILAAVGVVAYNGYTKSAKESATKAQHSQVAKYVMAELAKCNIESVVMDGNLSCSGKSYQTVVDAIVKTFSGLNHIYENSNHNDGYVSLEVDPFLANDFEKTLSEAEKLWAKVNKKNLMIKIPGTKEGIKATKLLLEKGINVNITLLFSFESYKNTLEAFIESKSKNNNSRSVASFFISRIDTAVDNLLDPKNK